MDKLEYAIDRLAGKSFETFAMAFLRVSGFKVQESDPRGRDGGWDARIETWNQMGIAHASGQEDWRAKIRADASSVADLEEEEGREYDLFVFVTNQSVTGEQQFKLEKEIEREYGWDVQIYHRQNLIGEIRTNHPELAEEFLDLNLGSESDQGKLVREFQSSRCEAILSREGYANELKDGPVIALHVLPTSMSPGEGFGDIGGVDDPRLLWEFYSSRAAVSGKVIFQKGSDSASSPLHSYTVVRNDGLYEAVTNKGFYDVQDSTYIQCDLYKGGPGLDAAVVLGVRDAKSRLEELGFTGTALVFVSLLNVESVSYQFNKGISFAPSSTGIHSERYTAEPATVSLMDENHFTALEPLLSEIYRELGNPHGTDNINEGEWVGGDVTIGGTQLL